MKLKHFLYPIACLILVVAFAACNSNNEYVIEGEQSAEGRIISFAIDATPFTAKDSLTYPSLKTTKFTINNRGAYHIFNNDSLPVGTEIRSVKLTLGYAQNTYQRTELVYPKDSTKYSSEWNGTDSVKFFRQKGETTYYPRLKVVAPSGYERTYLIDYSVHTQEPDSIVWHRMNNGNFKLPKVGESKVVLGANGSSFFALINSGGKVYNYTSPITNPNWVESDATALTDLPANALVKTLNETSEFYVLLANDGSAYTSPIADGKTWTKHGGFNIRSIVGLLPEVGENRTNPLNEFLVTCLDNAGTLVYAKTADFETLEDVKLSTRNDNKVLDGFPMTEFSALAKTINTTESFILTIAGKDSNNRLVKKPWMVKNVSLKTETQLAEVSVYPGLNSYILPYSTGLTAFLYNDKIEAISSDSLSLYQSEAGSAWAIAPAKQKLKKGNEDGMNDMNLPSVVVDKEDYMWVFGGVSNKTSVYSQKIWRGRINRLGFVRK